MINRSKKILLFFGIGLLILLVASLFLSSLNTARNKLTTFPGLDFGVSRQASVREAGESTVTRKKVIKTGSLSLIVNKAEDAVREIQTLAQKLGGFIEDSRVYEVSGGVKNGNITMRVPEDRFSEAMETAKEIAYKVESENTTARDVTEEYIDLEARLKNLSREEDQYRKIMERSGSISDTLQVARELARVRGEIERIEGQLQYISRQVEMATISINLRARQDIQIFGLEWRPLFAAKQSFRKMLENLTGSVDLIIAFVLYLPVLVLWGLLALVAGVMGRRIYRWIQKKIFMAPGHDL